MTALLEKLDELEKTLNCSEQKSAYDHVLTSPLRAECVLSRGMVQLQGAKITEVLSGSAPQWFIDELVGFKEMCVREHTVMDQATALKLIEALKKCVETLEQATSWCLDHEKCQVAECHFARETLREIEEMFK